MKKELKDVLGTFAFTFIRVTIGAAIVTIVLEAYVFKAEKPKCCGCWPSSPMLSWPCSRSWPSSSQTR